MYSYLPSQLKSVFLVSPSAVVSGYQCGLTSVRRNIQLCPTSGSACIVRLISWSCKVRTLRSAPANSWCSFCSFDFASSLRRASTNRCSFSSISRNVWTRWHSSCLSFSCCNTQNVHKLMTYFVPQRTQNIRVFAKYDGCDLQYSEYARHTTWYRCHKQMCMPYSDSSCALRESNPGAGRFSAPVHTAPGAHPASYTISTELPSRE